MGDDIPILVPIYEAWHHRVGVCARADEEENDKQERLEVEYCGLLKVKVVSLWEGTREWSKCDRVTRIPF
jgi:hypothetical protein